VNLASGQPTISAVVPDWSREAKAWWAWDPPKSLLASIRSYQRHHGSRNPLRVLACKLAVLRHRFWSVVTGADIPINSQIGGGFRMPHPNGIVIHPAAHIGVNCMVFQQVTIGMRDDAGAPWIGGHVDIGAGAKVLGPVHLGDHACIGANAVVLDDVPESATAAGIPARIVRINKGARQPIRLGPAGDRTRRSGTE
jgi:serine O-acetyltransferase